MDLESLIGYFMDSDLEHYECWKNNLGDEGLSEAAESKMAIPLLLAYDYIRNSSVDNIFSAIERCYDRPFLRSI